jgi:hypothetical protein
LDPVAAAQSASAFLEGYRRAMTRTRSAALLADWPRRDRTVTLTDVVESATEHAQGLAPRLAGIGERLDLKV